MKKLKILKKKKFNIREYITICMQDIRNINLLIEYILNDKEKIGYGLYNNKEQEI